MWMTIIAHGVSKLRNEAGVSKEQLSCSEVAIDYLKFCDVQASFRPRGKRKKTEFHLFIDDAWCLWVSDVQWNEHTRSWDNQWIVRRPSFRKEG